MASRPRGGWQAGTHAIGRRAPSPWTPDHPDPAPDCYGVERQGGSFIIRHYTTPASETPCCIITITPRPGESDIEALQRAYAPFALCARTSCR